VVGFVSLWTLDTYKPVHCLILLTSANYPSRGGDIKVSNGYKGVRRNEEINIMSISTAAGSLATTVRRRSALGGFIGGAMTRNALTPRGLTYVFVRRLISGRALNLATAHVNAETEGQLATVNRSADSYATGDNSAPLSTGALLRPRFKPNQFAFHRLV